MAALVLGATGIESLRVLSKLCGLGQKWARLLEGGKNGERDTVGVMGERAEVNGTEMTRHKNENLLRAIQKGIASMVLIVCLSGVGSLFYYPVGGETGQCPPRPVAQFRHFLNYDSLDRLCFPRRVGDDSFSFHQDALLFVSRSGRAGSEALGIMGNLYFHPHSTR